MNQKKNIAGFSMIELMVVMVILGLIAGLVGPRFFGRADVAKVQTAETQIQMLRSAINLFYLDVGRLPTTEEGLSALVRQPNTAQFWQGPYLDDEVPSDPWQNAYQYQNVKSGISDFSLFSLGADGARGGEDLNADVGLVPDA
ncbi:MAG: type II secretion system major pseudopilin GspG [Pseudomonadales bacterium]|nr:type II secretion system major pseudopilin GspG [Pseudomonadales bacterium]MBO7006552.1 type II secretion system major pseudopilin GspG [Pseudomonadales bacterium]